MKNKKKRFQTEFAFMAKFAFMAIIALASIIAFAGCGGGKTFTDVMEVEDWLAQQKGGASPEDPIAFSVRLNLQNMASPESNWQKLLTSINTAGLYIDLDLSGSTMPGTEFDADGGTKVGKNFIVSLTLPDSTASVEGVLYGHFGNLKTAKASNIEYLIGNKGPAGGTVFYDKGDTAGGWRYLEAAPAETEFKAEWGAYGQNIAGTEAGIGTGKRNTEIIVKYLNLKGKTGRAAQMCRELSVNGFNDWFLPSSDELGFMYDNLRKNKVGGFSDSFYWSSSQGYRSHSWYQHFANGSRGNSYDRDDSYSVRAVRAF